MFYRTEKSKNDRGFQGPATCIGTSGSLVISWYGGSVVKAHTTGCLLVKKDELWHPEYVDPSVLKVPMTAVDENFRVPITAAEQQNLDYDDSDEEMQIGFHDMNADSFHSSIPFVYSLPVQLHLRTADSYVESGLPADEDVHIESA